MGKEYIFEYKTLSKKAGVLISLIAFFIFLAGFVIFLILAFKTNIKYIWLANLSGIASLALSPFSSFSKLYCYFALREDNMLIMKSVIKMIPRSYIIDSRNISEVVQSGGKTPGTVFFQNENGEIMSRFNYNKMGYGDFKKHLGLLCEKNSGIKIKI